MRPMFTTWSPWLAALAAALVACSSSSGNGTTAGDGGTSGPSSSTCQGSVTYSMSSTCVPCLMAHCNAEESAYAGSNWATGSYASAGGACGDYFMCIAKCGCGATACLAGCAQSADCMSAGNAVDSCTMQSCQADCATSAVSVSNGLCVAANGGTCPTANLIGCCKTATLETCFYPPLTAAEGMQTCTNDGDAGT